MNANHNQKPTDPSKLKARISAIALIAVAIFALFTCTYWYFKNNFLKIGGPFNADMVNAMRMIIKVSDFWIIPCLSILLILSSLLIWKLSNRLEK